MYGDILGLPQSTEQISSDYVQGSMLNVRTWASMMILQVLGFGIAPSLHTHCEGYHHDHRFCL